MTGWAAIEWHRAGPVEYFTHRRYVAHDKPELPVVTLRRVGERDSDLYSWLTFPAEEFEEAVRLLAKRLDECGTFVAPAPDDETATTAAGEGTDR